MCRRAMRYLLRNTGFRRNQWIKRCDPRYPEIVVSANRDTNAVGTELPLAQPRFNPAIFGTASNVDVNL